MTLQDLGTSTHPTQALSHPTGYDLDTARDCSFLVDVAVEMCVQWINAGKPAPDSFSWNKGTSCACTNGRKVGSWTFGPLIWSTFVHKGTTYLEPFGITATAGSTTHVVFRGTQTTVDGEMDGLTKLIPYPPAGSAGTQVEQGFWTVYQGLAVNNDQPLRQYFAGLPAGTQLILSGHSLGSTLSTLAVDDARKAGVNTLVHNQASPMVGNTGFAQYYTSLQVVTYLLVNSYDVVPKLPARSLGYVPVVGPAYTATFGAWYADPDIHPSWNHDPCCSYSYALQFPQAPLNPDFKKCHGTAGSEEETAIANAVASLSGA